MPLLRSMTGHGQAQCELNSFRVAAELRAVNNRYFKLIVRGLEGYGYLESQIEALMRKTVSRGTVNLTLTIVCPGAGAVHQINEAALKSYCDQISELTSTLQLDPQLPVAALLQLPGVVTESTVASESDDDLWPALEAALSAALHKLQTMREAEGRAMFDDLQRNCGRIDECVKNIEQRAPEVVSAYETRLTDRINQLLAPHASHVEPADVAREVGMFAERCDVSEEVVRLHSHIAQFQKILEAHEPSGKKLEFVIQEMFREANTIGSKANDATIASWIIETKTLVERMREMVQNVE
jgi:uncharacterized protein (TIGR00255 family)